MKVGLIYREFLDPAGQGRRIGGIETYLAELGSLISDLGWEPMVIQSADVPFEVQTGPIRVVGVGGTRGRPRKRLSRLLYQAALARLDRQRDILVFATDNLSVPTHDSRCIAIQHGIGWDLPLRYMTNRAWLQRPPFSTLYRHFLAGRFVRAFDNCKYRVCVDYNFYNWYRTLSSREDLDGIWVIPNFVNLAGDPPPDRSAEAGEEVRIIFARRFGEYRGTRLMAAAVKSLLAKHQHVHVTFAGEGSDEPYLRSQFEGQSRVRIAKYRAEDAVAVHARHDIAVVPSIASEGTSLSVAEAMAAGCAVVATHVGGITNMIIDRYNGLLIPPNGNSLLAALEELVTHGDLRRQLAARARETATLAFSLELWRKRWSAVLRQVAAGESGQGADSTSPRRSFSPK